MAFRQALLTTAGLCLMEHLMIESQITVTHRNWRYDESVAQSGPITRVKTYEFERTDSQDVLRTGDHIHALPYWSMFSELSKTDVAGSLEAYNGLIYPYEYGRAATIHDWPWPEVPFRDYLVNRVSQSRLTFNVTGYVTHPPLALPEGSTMEWDSLTRLADTKALGNLRKALANLPMIMAERRETLKMIGKKVSSIAKSARALQAKSIEEFRKTKPKNRRAVANRISNEHLEFVFGWLPVISEVEGIAEFLQKDQLDFIRSRGTQVLRNESQISGNERIERFDAWSYCPHTWGAIRTTGTETTSIGVRTALRYKLSSQLVGDAYALGFDPVGTGFDLIPLSFISGWVSNFDYWVRTLTPEFGLEFQTGSRNKRRFHSFDVTGRYAKDSISYGFEVYGQVPDSHVYGITRRDERSVLTAAPLASLEWDVDVGLFEVTAGISLAIQRYLKPLKLLQKQKQFRYKGPRPQWLPKIRYTGRR